VEKPKEKTLGSHRRRREEMLKEIGWKCMDWIDLA
jgi:hypothetical protein